MKATESPRRYGRRAPMREDMNVAVPAVPAATTKGSTGRQQVAAARTLPTAESEAASAFRRGFPRCIDRFNIHYCLIPRFEKTKNVTWNGQSHAHRYDVIRFPYRHSSRNAMPTAQTTAQTKETLKRVTRSSDSRSTIPAMKNKGPVMPQ